ncbi:IclR family transcriptional regulator [Halobellus rufus]|uniref:IclR family transcriptional regulator n=1 Tax=Halobellus rufus TaxID=1448860 RepID=UPI0006785577|nr:IclR family transcriptional regulator [Halobellus rufus]
MAAPANHPIKSLEKTARIIDVLKRRRSAQLREIADELDLNKSTVHNHLATLREHEYVVKSGDEYRLSLQFLHIGGVLRNEVDLYDAAKAKLDQLAEETGALVTLATHERGLGVVLYRAKGEDAVEIDTHVGSQLTLHNSGLGKAILAHLPRERVEEIVADRGLPATTENSITDEDELYAELDRIAEQGYAFDDEENWRGLRCVAAPILTDDGVVKGAISLSVPKSQLASDAERRTYVDDIKNTANLIELRITYS